MGSLSSSIIDLTEANKFKFNEVIMASSKEYIDFVLDQCIGLFERTV